MTPNSYQQQERLSPLETDGEALLRSEIEFWQEIIATCPLSQSPESIERMHQALAFAESRLGKLLAESRATVWVNSFYH